MTTYNPTERLKVALKKTDELIAKQNNIINILNDMMLSRLRPKQISKATRRNNFIDRRNIDIHKKKYNGPERRKQNK